MNDIFALGNESFLKSEGSTERKFSREGETGQHALTVFTFPDHVIVLPVRVRRTVVGPYRVRSKVRVSI